MLLDQATNHIEYLHEHSHPTMEGATQLMTDQDWAGIVHPAFCGLHFDVCLHEGCSAEFMLQYELPGLVNLSDEWHSDATDWRKEFGKLFGKSLV